MEMVSIRKAGIEDIPDLERLINSAYRGESSKKGWTTEADLLEGIRIDQESLWELIEGPRSIILTAVHAEEIIGCVNLQKQGEKLYLGMLTVSPLIQTQGVGKELLKASEAYAGEVKCHSILMTVISVRHELIRWYERRGYKASGEKEPFPADSAKFGIPRQELEFVVLEKFFL